MALLIARIRPLFVWLVLLLPSLGWAQGYEVSGESSLTGSFTLTVYDGDSTSHSYTEKATKGRFRFAGKVERPTLAAVEHPAMQFPLFFYLENSRISVSVNATHPDASVIKGSRSNSEYRYLMERLRSAPDPDGFLRQEVKDNSSSRYLPFVLYRQMSNMDDVVLRQLIVQLTGEARSTYHYTLLRRWMRQTPTVAEGSEMPDFAWLDAGKKRCTFAAERDTDGYTLVFFGANWCDRCHSVQDVASRLLEEKNAKMIVINIDDNPNGWDAQNLKQLAVDHVPYMILVDSRGYVVSRDMRIWELEKWIRKLKIQN